MTPDEPTDDTGPADRFDLFTTPVATAGTGTTFGLALLYRPPLLCFFHERGLDVTSVPRWELPFLMTDRDVRVRSDDPWEVALETTYDGDRLELVVNEGPTLVEGGVVEDV